LDPSAAEYAIPAGTTSVGFAATFFRLSIVNLSMLPTLPFAYQTRERAAECIRFNQIVKMLRRLGVRYRIFCNENSHTCRSG